MSRLTISKTPNPDLEWNVELDGWINTRLHQRLKQWQAGTITVEAMLPSEREDIQDLVVAFHNGKMARKLQKS